MGLSICKLIVKKIGGDITVNSKPNVGTTFSVVICASSLIKEEPKFLRRYTIQPKDSEQNQPSERRPGGYVRLSSDNLGHYNIFDIPNEAPNDIFDSEIID